MALNPFLSFDAWAAMFTSCPQQLIMSQSTSSIFHGVTRGHGSALYMRDTRIHIYISICTILCIVWMIRLDASEWMTTLLYRCCHFYAASHQLRVNRTQWCLCDVTQFRDVASVAHTHLTRALNNSIDRLPVPSSSTKTTVKVGHFGQYAKHS